ncbi:MAG: hypothetical protein ACJ8AI_24045 [Rhodopila sp.]
MDDVRLMHGFHDFEPDEGIRWTKGDALLPGGWFNGLSGEITLTLHLSGTTFYVDDGAADSEAA